VRSWIWDVFTPQIEHLRWEREVLAKSLTFVSARRGFEGLAPLRNALMPDGQQIYDDLHGDLPDYDRLARRHDAALEALRQRAETLHSHLVESADFRDVLRRIIEELRSEGGEHLPASPGESDWIRYLAENVVNDLSTDLPRDRFGWRVWNRGAPQLKAAARREESEGLLSERARFAKIADETHERLFALRKKLSREYDIPVVPVRGAHLEGALD
jgi:hypothetical protein